MRSEQCMNYYLTYSLSLKYVKANKLHLSKLPQVASMQNVFNLFKKAANIPHDVDIYVKVKFCEIEIVATIADF